MKVKTLKNKNISIIIEKDEYDDLMDVLNLIDDARANSRVIEECDGADEFRLRIAEGLKNNEYFREWCEEELEGWSD
jgi:hypothetical protein